LIIHPCIPLTGILVAWLLKSCGKGIFTDTQENKASNETIVIIVFIKNFSFWTMNGEGRFQAVTKV
jgi:hypothetical protein